MWKPAAAVIIVTLAGATAHAQQQQSHQLRISIRPYQSLHKGYEIKAAEGLSGDMPKFVLQKAHSIIVCQIQLFPLEKRTVSNLGRGGGDGLEIKR